MALKIQDAGDVRVDRLVCTIYGQPSSGKTTLALSADKPLVLDFDGGIARALNRAGKAVVQANEWADVRNMSRQDVAPYSTLVVDTVGMMLTKMSAEIAKRPHMSYKDGRFSLQGYGALRNEFERWLSLVRGYGCDIVFIAHSSEQQRDDEVVERIEAMGSSKQIIYQQSDLMGRLGIANNGARQLVFDPSSATLGKNIGLPQLTIPDATGGIEGWFTREIMDKARQLLNRLTAQQEAQHELRQLISALPVTAEAYNKQMLLMSDAPRADKNMLYEIGIAAGLGFDKSLGRPDGFTDPEGEELLPAAPMPYE